MTTGRQVMGLEIMAMQKACEEMQPYQRNDCPYCSYPLRTSPDGIISCLCCGWQDHYPLKRDFPKV